MSPVCGLMTGERREPDDPLGFIRRCVGERRVYWSYHVNMRMRDRWPEVEEKVMKCHVCGGRLEPAESDMPFKIDARRIVILKHLPVLQCRSCGEYLIEDAVLAQVDAMLAGSDERAELKIMSYAA